MRYKGIAKGKFIELEETLPYSEGQPVNVSIEPFDREFQPGSPVAILKTMRNLPRINPKDVDELEHVIEQGRLPVREKDLFGGKEQENLR
jgi:hypothetical protein